MSYGCKCNCDNFKDHVGLGPAVTAESMPTRGNKRTLHVNATDRQWDRDGEAYTRLRRQGYQPPRIDGCADLEKNATHPIEIEHGKVYGKRAGFAAEVQDAIRSNP